MLAELTMPLLAELTPKLSWYIARSTGIVAWALLTASVLWGLFLSARVLNKHTVPGWLLDLHRFLGAAAVLLTGVHLLALVGDNWLHVGWSEVLVPLASTYRPRSIAWGVAAFYLLIAVELTSVLRARVGRRIWRATHYLSFPMFVLTTAHGIASGTDARLRAYEWLVVGSVTAVGLFAIVRLIATRDSKAESATPRAAGAKQAAA